VSPLVFRASLVETCVMTTLALALLLLTVSHPRTGQDIGSVTLLEGSLRVIRGTTLFEGAEGMRIMPGDMIESSEGGFVQLEFGNGAIVALGPSSRMYILRDSASEAKGELLVTLDLVMLNGWLKVESVAGKQSYRFRSPLLAASATGGAGGTVVVRSNPKACDVFVESGTISIGELNPSGNSGRTTPAKVGQFFSRQEGTRVSNLARPTTAFLEAMPRQFRDTLPPRAARYTGKPVEPKAEHPVTYEEIGHWLAIPTAWRKGLAERFAPRLSDPEFRRQITNHLKEFPEWDPILHPKKDSESPNVRN